jgi:hypothetical protein
MALRKWARCVEPLFKEAKDWHGLGHLRLWRLLKVNIGDLRIEAELNLHRYPSAKH